MLQNTCSWTLLVIIVVVTTEGGGKDFPLSPTLSVSITCMYSFIYLRDDFQELSCKSRGWGIQGWACKTWCLPFNNSCLRISLSSPAAFLLSVHVTIHAPPTIPGDPDFWKDDLHAHNSPQYVFLGQSGSYGWLQLLRCFIMKSRILLWARRIMDLERFLGHIKFWHPLQTARVFESCTTNLWFIWLLFWYMLWIFSESGQFDF